MRANFPKSGTLCAQLKNKVCSSLQGRHPSGEKQTFCQQTPDKSQTHSSSVLSVLRFMLAFAARKAPV